MKSHKNYQYINNIKIKINKYRTKAMYYYNQIWSKKKGDCIFLSNKLKYIIKHIKKINKKDCNYKTNNLINHIKMICKQLKPAKYRINLKHK